METKLHQFYIDGQWVSPASGKPWKVVNPATEMPIAEVLLGSAADVDRAVSAAREAFKTYSLTPVVERQALLKRILSAYQRRLPEIARAISSEMGAPISLAHQAQAPVALGHLGVMIEALSDFAFDHAKGDALVTKEPIGVCGLITPWNWPIHQILCKVTPALAAGCTVVLKPSELAPLSALLFAEVIHEAEVPKGVFNLVLGDGETVGRAMAAHHDIEMISFTGSTRAGVEVAKAAAGTVKRVHQELGGKSAFIVLPDADLEAAAQTCVQGILLNSGQSCNAPSRMLVPAALKDEVVKRVRSAVEAYAVGDPTSEATRVGPVAGKMQFDKVRSLIATGVGEGATLVCGGAERPEGLTRGYYIRPTVFSNVQPSMTLARQEVFGPVLAILTYDSEEMAVQMANDTDYGLSNYVFSGSLEKARRIARKLRSGNVHINGAQNDLSFPFGGYKHSGNGREFGRYGLEDFLETKAILGWGAEHDSAGFTAQDRGS